ncbi:hypothetical protein [Pseudogemmobacter sp. W21_MBD1_M6]|uniref:hypothetical protein n=1 Tax=Pseudogemmobacter sp. W21_MBD1_M6 TaxID=3240271 RepID=UPI003F98D9E7
MALRLYHCAKCGHKMRLASSQCGRCYSKKPFHQTIGALFLVVVCIGSVTVVAFA